MNRARIGRRVGAEMARIAALCFAGPLRLWALAGGGLQIVALLFAGLFVSVVVALVVWLQVVDHQRTEFEWVSHDRNRALEKGVEDALDAVQSVVDLLRVDTDVERSEFRLFADLLLERHPAIRRLEWVPRVRIGDDLQPSAATVSPVAPHVSSPSRLPAPLAADLEPGAGVPPASDQLIDPAIGALIGRATATEQTVIGRRVPIGSEAGRYGIFVAAPVLPRILSGDGATPDSSAGADEPLGVVVGLVDLSDLAERAVSVLEPRGVECVLRDHSAPPGEEFLSFYASRLESPELSVRGAQREWSVPDARHVTDRFAVADRLWSATCAPTPRYRSAVGLHDGPWIVFGGCLAVTLLTVMFVYSLRQQAQARLGVEQELRASEQQLRVLFSQSPDVIMTVDARGRIIMVNRPWPKAPDQSAVGRNSSKLLPKGLRKWYRNALQSVLARGEAEHFQYSEADSSYWEVRIVPLHSARSLNSAMVIATDVTERRLLEAQAIRSARFATLGVLSASVAHEVNNPNNAIQFNATLLKRSFADIVPILRRERAARGDFLIGGVSVAQAIEGLPRMLTDLLRNTQRIQGIVSNLKRMAGHDPGDYGALVDLGKVLRSAYSILQHAIQKHTDHCELLLPKRLPRLSGNAQQLEQVFVNLLLNALQALPDRSSRVWITAAVAPDGKRLRVAIVDQGMGINEDDLASIFDPFFTTRTDDGGTGLGLSISRRILQNHGGCIEIDSIPGIGTEVVVSLPIAKAATVPLEGPEIA